MRAFQPWMKLLTLGLMLLLSGFALAEDKILFDFEDADSIKAWSNIDVQAMRQAEAKAAIDALAKSATNPATVPVYRPPASMPAEPAVRIDWTTEGVSVGQHALKLTFAGGRMPTVSTACPVDDWRRYKSFAADVTVSRTCMVVFRALAETSKYGTGYNEGTSRWEFAARCVPGKNAVVAPAPNYANVLWKDVKTFEIYLYQPQADESITVDHIRLSTDKPKFTTPFNESPPLPPGGFKVLGTDLVVKDVNDLADKLKPQWTRPDDQSLDQVEASIQAEYQKLRQDHPKAVLVTLRDGQKGYDPADPDKPFAGWADAGTPSHLPMGLTLANFANAGKSTDIEACFRNRPAFLRVDLSSLPKGADILSARLILTRGVEVGKNWQTSPALFVAEPCNRPWTESEVTVFEPAHGQLWLDYAAQAWGADGDAVPLFLAHGRSSGKTMTWDFTHAIKYWTTENHPNHGFTLHGAPKYVDYLHLCTREHPDAGKRPALAVIYDPPMDQANPAP